MDPFNYHSADIHSQLGRWLGLCTSGMAKQS